MMLGGLGVPATVFGSQFGGVGPGFAAFGGGAPFGFPFAKPFGAFPFAKPFGAFPFAKPFGFAGFPASAFGTTAGIIPSTTVATTPI